MAEITFSCAQRILPKINNMLPVKQVSITSKKVKIIPRMFI